MGDGVTLDMDTLAQYAGEGKCGEVTMRGMRYRNQLKVWAGNMGWQIEEMGLWHGMALSSSRENENTEN